MTAIIVATGSCLLSLPVLSQPKAEIRIPEKVDPVKAAKRGQELVHELLDQKPQSGSSTTGWLTTRDVAGKTATVLVSFSVDVTATNITSRYLAKATNGSPDQLLIIHQQHGQANEYSFASGANAPQRLSRDEVMKPFAGSEFWFSDLGLDFLHWPGQFVIGQGMRRGQSCEALESRIPNAPPGGYSRVVSWIASEKPGIMLVHADAYDAKDRLLKQFSPKDLQRVEGRWQLRSMEIRNRQTGARSVIEFDLDS